MNRRSLLFALGSVLILVVVIGVIVGLVRHEPGRYRELSVAPGKERKQLSSEVKKEFIEILEGFLNERPWSARLTNEQINSYFEEDFVRNGTFEINLPEDIREPRVAIEADKLRLAFRYGADPWSTVVSIDLRVWLAPKESNVIVLELQGMKAGSMPFSARSLLETISDIFRRQKIDVSPWYRHDGNPTALLRIQSDKATPSMQIKRLELLAGELIISGAPTEANTAPPTLPPTPIKPAAN